MRAALLVGSESMLLLASVLQVMVSKEADRYSAVHT